MQVKKLSIRWLYGFGAVVLIAILAFLVLQTRAINFNVSNEIIGTLRDLKQVDAEWNVDVLRAKTGLATNYDQVASPLPLVAKLEGQLSETTNRYWLGHDESILAMRPMLEQFQSLMTHKINTIEHFKSQNAILRNSSRFLPVAAADLVEATRGGEMSGGAKQATERLLNDLLANAMSYTQNPDAALRQRVLDDAEALRTQTQAYGSDVKERAETLVAHVRTLLRQQDRGAELLAELSAMPTAKAIDSLSDTHSRENDKLIARLQNYQRALAAYSACLLALLAFLGWKLFGNYQLLNKTNDDLQRANRELKESQVHLVQSEKMSALGQMVAGIAHEINTPLAYIKSTFAVLRDQLSPLEGLAQHSREFASAMRAPVRDQVLAKQHFFSFEAAANEVADHGVIGEMNNLLKDGTHGIEQISEIVLNLKNFSRLDREKVTDFSVEAGLESTLLLARNLLKSSVTIRKDYSHVPNVIGSPSQINQVFLNIITNAVHAMPERVEPNVITLRTSISPDGDMVQVEIQDNGTGIPESVLPNIFDPFFTTKPIGQGTGMGLSISYKIIQEHGGQILVDTTKDVGTVFTILLPLERAYPEPNEASETLSKTTEAVFAD